MARPRYQAVEAVIPHGATRTVHGYKTVKKENGKVEYERTEKQVPISGDHFMVHFPQKHSLRMSKAQLQAFIAKDKISHEEPVLRIGEDE